MSKKRKVEASKADVVDETKDVTETDSTDGRGTRGSMPLCGTPLSPLYTGVANVCITKSNGLIENSGTIHTQTIMDTLDKARELVCKLAIEFFLTNGIMKEFEWNYANQFPKASYTKQLSHFREVVVKNPPKGILTITCYETYYILELGKGCMSKNYMTAVCSGAFGEKGPAEITHSLHSIVYGMDKCIETKDKFTDTSAIDQTKASSKSAADDANTVSTDVASASDAKISLLEKDRPTVPKWRNMAQAASDCDAYGFRQLFFSIGDNVNCRDTVNGKPREPYATLLYHCVNGTNVDTFKRLFPAPTFIDGIEKHRNQLDIIRMLIINKADVNLANKWDGKDWFSTPLHHADSIEVVKLLLDAKADIDARDDVGKTPIMTVAYDSKRRAVVEFLKSRGANLDLEDKNGRSAKFHIGFR